jgi:hypothetical protein
VANQKTIVCKVVGNAKMHPSVKDGLYMQKKLYGY